MAAPRTAPGVQQARHTLMARAAQPAPRLRVSFRRAVPGAIRSRIQEAQRGIGKSLRHTFKLRSTTLDLTFPTSPATGDCLTQTVFEQYPAVAPVSNILCGADPAPPASLYRAIPLITVTATESKLRNAALLYSSNSRHGSGLSSGWTFICRGYFANNYYNTPALFKPSKQRMDRSCSHRANSRRTHCGAVCSPMANSPEASPIVQYRCAK